MRIGVLVTGAPPAELIDRYGNYGDMVARFLAPAAEEVRCYQALEGELPERTDECDVYALTGSACSVYEDLDWIRRTEQFCLRAHDAGGWFVGICFGHQLLAQVFGGEVRKSERGWGVGIHDYRVWDQAEWMQPRRESFASIALHQDQVEAPPPGARVLAGSDFCPYGMLTIGERVLTIQTHPEMGLDYADELYEARRPALGPDNAAAARASLSQGHDHDLIGQWVSRFLSPR